VSSELPLGTPVEVLCVCVSVYGDGVCMVFSLSHTFTHTHNYTQVEGSCMPTVSAGHESHPSTTHAATESVFEFLDCHVVVSP
jgi:hypothetical protein